MNVKKELPESVLVPIVDVVEFISIVGDDVKITPSLNVNESGNIYRMLQQLIGKINYIQRENL